MCQWGETFSSAVSCPVITDSICHPPHFPANCTNVSSVLTCFSHQLRLGHTGGNDNLARVKQITVGVILGAEAEECQTWLYVKESFRSARRREREMCWGCISSRTQRHNPGGQQTSNTDVQTVRGLSGCWFHSRKTQTISHTNTLRPMLIPEQEKSTWQPIKSWELCSSFAFQWYCLWCAGECLYWPVF